MTLVKIGHLFQHTRTIGMACILDKRGRKWNTPGADQTTFVQENKEFHQTTAHVWLKVVGRVIQLQFFFIQNDMY